MRKQRKNKTSFIGPAARLCLSVVLLNGAAGIGAREAEEFKPSGSPIVVLFADYTAGMSDAREAAGFNLTRSRLGYRYRATPSLSAVSVLDVNATLNGRGANFHYAFLQWTWKGLSVDGGLVALAQFAEQEAFWGRRYVEKSFQDLYGFGPDSDLGILLKYRFAPWLEADAALVNGSDLPHAEGIRMNRFAWGLASRPLAGLRLRAYFDVNRHSDMLPDCGPAPAYANQTSVALFAGYKNEFFSIGAEYNQQMAKDFTGGNNYFGLSLYGGLALGGKFDLYARYDYVDTESPSGQAYNWASVANETMWIAGLEYRPAKNLQISPNYRYRRPVGGEGAHFIGLNVGFSL